MAPPVLTLHSPVRSAGSQLGDYFDLQAKPLPRVAPQGLGVLTPRQPKAVAPHRWDVSVVVVVVVVVMVVGWLVVRWVVQQKM